MPPNLTDYSHDVVEEGSSSPRETNLDKPLSCVSSPFISPIHFNFISSYLGRFRSKEASLYVNLVPQLTYRGNTIVSTVESLVGKEGKHLGRVMMKMNDYAFLVAVNHGGLGMIYHSLITTYLSILDKASKDQPINYEIVSNEIEEYYQDLIALVKRWRGLHSIYPAVTSLQERAMEASSCYEFLNDDWHYAIKIHRSRSFTEIPTLEDREEATRSISPLATEIGDTFISRVTRGVFVYELENGRPILNLKQLNIASKTWAPGLTVRLANDVRRRLADYMWEHFESHDAMNTLFELLQPSDLDYLNVFYNLLPGIDRFVESRCVVGNDIELLKFNTGAPINEAVVRKSHLKREDQNAYSEMLLLKFS